MSDTPSDPSLPATPEPPPEPRGTRGVISQLQATLMMKFWICVGVLFLTLYATWSTNLIGGRGQALCGIFVFPALVALFSRNLLAIQWRPIFFGFGLQVFLALFIIKFEVHGMEWCGIPDGTRPGAAFFNGVAGVIREFLTFSQRGASFVFGQLVEEGPMRQAFGREAGPIFAFSVLPTIIFVSSFFTILYYFGILQFVVRTLSRVVMSLLGTSGAETLSAVANVFMGQTEAPLIVKPFVPRMTTSEMLAMMVGGMATISGSLMAVYIGFNADAVALLATSVMAAPCSLYMAKILIPETETPVTSTSVRTVEDRTHRNVIDAAAAGASDGMHLAINVAAMLIAFIALIAMLDALLRAFPTNTRLSEWLYSDNSAAIDVPRKLFFTVVGFAITVWVLRWPFVFILRLLGLDQHLQDWKKAIWYAKVVPVVMAYLVFLGVLDLLMRSLPEDLSLGRVFGALFYPFAILIGVPEKDATLIAQLLGTKLVANEFVAFLDLQRLAQQLDQRSIVLATYALTGFANFASVGIQIGGIGAMAPERRADLARLGMPALFVGFLVTMLNAAIAGFLL